MSSLPRRKPFRVAFYILVVLSMSALLSFGRALTRVPFGLDSAQQQSGTQNFHKLSNRRTPTARRFVYCLSGSSTGQVDELIVSLKSLLVHPSETRPMVISVLYDDMAIGGISKVKSILSSHIPGDEMCTSTSHDTLVEFIFLPESKIEKWRETLEGILGKYFLADRHTFGTFWRLFLWDAIPRLVATICKWFYFIF